jgi:DNA-binding response OmpR family regulator
VKVLLIEDSLSLQRSLSAALSRSGYAVDTATSGSEGLWHSQTGGYDVVILDLMLPDLDGLSVLQRIRERTSSSDIHVLLLTAKDTVADRVAGLRAGADDYLTKPFSVDELLARVEALVRRRHGHKNPRIRYGNLEVDTAARVVRRDGNIIELTPREYAVLHLLMLHAGEVVTRTQIEASIYNEHVEPMSNVIDAAIYAVRRKIDGAGQPSMILTRRGMGYVFQPPTDAEAQDDSHEPLRKTKS